MDFDLNRENEVVDENNYFNAILVNDDGSFSKMDEKEKINILIGLIDVNL